MLRSISSKQLSEWMAFFNLEPFGFKATIFGHAITSSVIANVNSKKKFKPDDFMPTEKQIHQPGEFYNKLKAFLLSKQRKR